MNEDDKNKAGAQGAQNAAEGQGQSTGETTPADGQNGDSGDSDKPESTLPQSQEELDKLIERRLKKERRAWEKEKYPEPKTEGGTAPDTSADDTLKAENAALRAELLEAKAQSTASKLGFKADAVEDAVYLAMRIANKDSDGAPDEDDIKSALSDVLKKHPEWKADSEKKGAGFRVGAPSPQQSAANAKPTAQKRWNKFNH